MREAALARRALEVSAWCLLAVVAVSGIQSTKVASRPGEVRAADAEFRRFSCVQRQLDRTLAPGVRVFVDVDPAANTLWFQRLSEMATPRALVVSGPAGADLRISIVRAGSECGDVTVRIAPR